MAIEKSIDKNQPVPDTAADRQLRGDDLKGPQSKDAVDHTAYEERRNPDTELRLDGEKDSLYSDGLDIEEDTDPLAGTGASSTGSGIKP